MDSPPNPSADRLRPWPRPQVAWAGAAGAVLIATTLVALGDGVHPGEEPLFRAANDLPRALGLPLEVVMPLGTSIGALVLVAVAVLAGRRRLALAGFVAWAIGRASSALLKWALDRPRPTGLLTDVALRQGVPIDQAFPSAHTTGAVALAVVVAWAWPRARWAAVGVALLVAVARMYVGVHLPLDLLGGAALGLLAGLAATTAVDRWWPPGPAGEADPGSDRTRQARR